MASTATTGAKNPATTGSTTILATTGTKSPTHTLSISRTECSGETAEGRFPVALGEAESTEGLGVFLTGDPSYAHSNLAREVTDSMQFQAFARYGHELAEELLRHQRAVGEVGARLLVRTPTKIAQKVLISGRRILKVADKIVFSETRGQNVAAIEVAYRNESRVALLREARLWTGQDPSSTLPVSNAHNFVGVMGLSSEPTGDVVWHNDWGAFCAKDHLDYDHNEPLSKVMEGPAEKIDQARLAFAAILMTAADDQADGHDASS
ncbi:unnamed protein product [Parajaminaea phylloscopi]